MAPSSHCQKDDTIEKWSLLEDPKDQDFSVRLEATTYVHQLGHQLKQKQHTICSAIVYIHKFYVEFDFTDVEPNKLAMTSLFIAGKALDDFRRLEYVIKEANRSWMRSLDVNSGTYQKIYDDIIIIETCLLSVLGFKCDVKLPHPYVVKICELISGSELLAKQSYWIATASVTATIYSVQYEASVVACACVNLAAKWTEIEINQASGKKPWYYYIASSLKEEFLDKLTEDLEKKLLRAGFSSSSSMFKFIGCAEDERPLEATELMNYEEVNSNTRPVVPEDPCFRSSTGVHAKTASQIVAPPSANSGGPPSKLFKYGDHPDKIMARIPRALVTIK